MVFQQNLLENAYFIAKMPGLAMVRPASSDLWKAPLVNDRYGPKENFAKICQIKWNWIRSVKFELVWIDF